MKNIKCIYLLPVICICFLYACGGKTQEKKFFDIPGYFKSEIDSIKKNYTRLTKTAVYNNNTSQQQLKVSSINWEKEFALFLETDMNKPVYYANMIQRPGAGLDTNGVSTIYESQSPKLSIQKVIVGYTELPQGNQPVFVSVDLKKSNLISITSIHAFYNQGVGYEISGEQTVKNIGEKNTFFVKGKFDE